jgi:electron transfer flavoprotein alpha/beta subunit
VEPGHRGGGGKVYWIADASAEQADAAVIAKVLAAAILRLEPYDAILCGEGSSDLFNQQTASRLAALLGLPCLSLVNQPHIDGRTITATRKLANCTEQATVDGPVVISVRNDINRPRIPTLKQILGAARKPIEEIRLGALDISPRRPVAESGSPLGPRPRDDAQGQHLQGRQRSRQGCHAARPAGPGQPALKEDHHHDRYFSVL